MSVVTVTAPLFLLMHHNSVHDLYPRVGPSYEIREMDIFSHMTLSVYSVVLSM